MTTDLKEKQRIASKKYRQSTPLVEYKRRVLAEFVIKLDLYLKQLKQDKS